MSTAQYRAKYKYRVSFTNAKGRRVVLRYKDKKDFQQDKSYDKSYWSTKPLGFWKAKKRKRASLGLSMSLWNNGKRGWL